MPQGISDDASMWWSRTLPTCSGPRGGGSCKPMIPPRASGSWKRESIGGWDGRGRGWIGRYSCSSVRPPEKGFCGHGIAGKTRRRAVVQEEVSEEE
ncbi:hypothetical protein KSP39_PZI019199 [Platanthera zijinensis]|uniref:Uncharacterized protein n=1 Tax=Platanthera zijinensis TaxID=2320716 RepID=A0AAP0FY76_9ASPA